MAKGGKGGREADRAAAAVLLDRQTELSLPFGRFSVGGLFCRRRRFRIKPPRVKRWAVEVTQGGDGHGNASERRSGSAMPSATRAPAFRHLRLFLTLGGSTESQLHHAAAGSATDGGDGGPKKQNETEAININPHPDGRTDCSHVGQQRGEERGHMSTRRREFCSERRAEERSGGSRSYTELMKPRVWFASIHRFPPEVEHESFVLKMGLLRL